MTEKKKSMKKKAEKKPVQLTLKSLATRQNELEFETAKRFASMSSALDTFKSLFQLRLDLIRDNLERRIKLALLVVGLNVLLSSVSLTLAFIQWWKN